MKKQIILILLLIISIFTVNVYAEEDFNFSESQNLSMNAVPMACSTEANTSYCLSYDNLYGSASIYQIDLREAVSTKIKELTNTVLYSSLEKIDNGYLAVGFVVRGSNNLIITHFDDDFNIVNNINIHTNRAYTGAKLIKENGKYYILNQSINTNNFLAVELSEDLLTATQVNEESLSGQVLEMAVAYNKMTQYNDESNIILNIEKLNDGYIILSTTESNTDCVLAYYKDGEQVWRKDVYNTNYGSLIVKDDYFYVSKEDTPNRITTFEKYSVSGELLKSIPIDVLNDQGRFFFSNYNIAVRDDQILIFSYYLNGQFGTLSEMINWRITYVDTKNQINKIDSKNGSFTLSKPNAFTDEEIEISVSPNKGYLLDKIIVKDIKNNLVEVKNNKFIMPNSSVTVEVLFKKQIINPKTFTNILLIIGIISIPIISVLLIKKKKSIIK